jgi:hypothetical protein
LLTREFIGTILISSVLALALFIFFRVRLRRLRQESRLEEPQQPKAGESLFSCHYVASVFAVNPLERVWAYGLGHRGRAEIRQSDAGISIVRQGERDFLIPFTEIVGVERCGATIDRGVENRGLTQIRWKLGGEELVTSLRITANQELNAARLVQLIEGK